MKQIILFRHSHFLQNWFIDLLTCDKEFTFFHQKIYSIFHKMSTLAYLWTHPQWARVTHILEDVPAKDYFLDITRIHFQSLSLKSLRRWHKRFSTYSHISNLYTLISPPRLLIFKICCNHDSFIPIPNTYLLAHSILMLSISNTKSFFSVFLNFSSKLNFLNVRPLL